MSIIKFDVEKIKSQEDFNGAINELLHIIDDRTNKTKLISRFMIDLIDYFESLPQYENHGEALVFDCLCDYVEQYIIKSKSSVRIENAIVIIQTLTKTRPIAYMYKNINRSRPQTIDILKFIIDDKSLFYDLEVKEELLNFINYISYNNYCVFDNGYDFVIEALENIEKDISSNLYHSILEVKKRYFRYKINNVPDPVCNIKLENKFQTDIDYIAHDNVVYLLRKILTLDVHYTLDGYYISEKETGIEAFGKDIRTA
ncbi:MAG TPA: hypothetical protein PK507_05080, partial [bacterium]|nr:hypothetical protein [bacterium]